MATQTQTLNRGPAQAGRTHDYLYDPHFVVSSERDHARATFKAHTSTDRVKRVPNYPTMFSELRHHPRFQMKLDVTDPVPKFISRQWRGYGEQAREALVRYTTFNYDPSVQIPQKNHGPSHVSGQDRYKFFRRPRKERHGSAKDSVYQLTPNLSRPLTALTICTPLSRPSRATTADSRPIIPFMQQVPPDVHLASARQDPLAAAGGADGIAERPPTPATKTCFTQTDYRDSEAQTDPYTPEYVVRPGSQPELLTLATLSYGRGLPAGLAEVEMIERARAKRSWEATLPPLNDVSQLDKRRKMMDEMERKEWALREQEIEKLQEARLEVLKNLLKQREEHHQDLNTKRLDRLWAKKQEDKEQTIMKVRSEHIKAIRKLTEKRRKVEGKLERRDIINDYSDYASQSYAPLTRIGVFLDRGSEQFVVKSRYLNTFQGLLELENSLPDFVTQPRIKAPKPKTVTKTGFTKRKYRQEKELKEIHEVIKENRTKVQDPPKPLRFLQKIEKPIPRPATPTVEVPSEEEEERELAVILLQQVIRGRAIQNMMFEGKEKRIELIKELRSTHALQDAEQSIKRQEKQATLALQRQRRLHEHKESHVDEGLSQLEGESLGDMLDFLSKELIRLQEERRIHAFSMLAERQRRIREAEESGKRQVEERRRREEDEIFKQVVKVHQNSVDTYLEDMILLSVDQTADRQARDEIRDYAEKVNDIAYETEQSRTGLESEEIVSEMVHGFLLPEVQKKTMRDKVHNQQRKFLVAAHEEIFKTGEGLIEMHPNTSRGKKPQTDSTSTTQTTTDPKEGMSDSGPTDQPGSKSGSRAGSPRASQTGSLPSSKPPSQAGSRKASIAGSKSGSPRASETGSKPGTPAGSAAGSPRTSVAGSRAGSKAGSPRGSKAGSPPGSKAGSPPGSKAGSPPGSKAGSPPGSKAGSPPGSKAGSPPGSKAGSPPGSKAGSRAGSRPGSAAKEGSNSPALGVEGSRPPSVTKEGSRPSSVAKADSRPGSATKDRSRPPSVAKEGSRPSSATKSSSRRASAASEKSTK